MWTSSLILPEVSEAVAWSWWAFGHIAKLSDFLPGRVDAGFIQYARSLDRAGVRSEQAYIQLLRANRWLWLLVPEPDARVLTIDSLPQLERLLRRYPRSDSPQPALDFEALVEHYDGLRFTRAGVEQTQRLGMGSWVCESTLWFRWRFELVVNLNELVPPAVPLPSGQVLSRLLVDDEYRQRWQARQFRALEREAAARAREQEEEAKFRRLLGECRKANILAEMNGGQKVAVAWRGKLYA